VYILSAGDTHVTSSENNSSIIIASENFRDESCICITMFGKERWRLRVNLTFANKQTHVTVTLEILLLRYIMTKNYGTKINLYCMFHE
jgi:hypothetical protein